jgi:LysM repeat protein
MHKTYSILYSNGIIWKVVTMGKIIYDPRQAGEKGTSSLRSKESIVEKGKKELESIKNTYDSLIESIDSVRPIGDTECDYVVYMEDYVYTYMYQYAATNLDAEHAGVLVGEFYPETKEVIVCGMLPVPKEYLKNEEDWITHEALSYLKTEKEKYFSGASLIGWMHMQPGYGTMLTMKEVKIHRDLFDKQGSILLLMDAINKIETFYVFEEDTLKEQSGYYIYYDKNPSMQQYMLENPFVVQEKTQQEDGLVNQFRELGRKRKKEYEQKRRMNFTVAASALSLLAMSAVLLKITDQRSQIQDLQTHLAKTLEGSQQVADNVQFTIEPSQNQLPPSLEFTIEGVEPVESIEEVIEVMGEAEEVIVEKEQVVEVETQKEITTAENVQEQPQVDAIEVVEVANEKEDLVVEDYIEYVVQPGDTLLKISYAHYKTEKRARDIIQMNSIENGDNIFIGQKLKLPVE